MAQSLHIGGVEVLPGQTITLDLPVARLYTHTEMTMLIQVVRGKKDGPGLFISSAIHGDEINGVEIIRQLLRRKALRYLRGTLIAVPVVNVFGFINRSRYLPDRRDLNRFFPGSDSGSLAARIAHLFMEEVVANCDYGIDLHTGSNHRSNLPQIRAQLSNPETARLAQAFSAPVILEAGLRDGSLRQAVAEQDKPMLLYEAGEALRFDKVAIRAGVEGILAVMREIGLLSPSRRRRSRIEPLVARSSTWVRAPRSGILHTATRLGAWVKKGERLGEIADPFGENPETVAASASGVIIGQVRLPLVNRGEALFHIARSDSADAADATLDAFQSEFAPDLDTRPLDELWLNH